MDLKRGQATVGAAVLLAVVAGLLIMFIILVSPEQRSNLLDEIGRNEEGVAEGNLLLETPGRLDFLKQKEVEHPLPIVNIYTREESKIIAEKNIAEARRSVFSEGVTLFRFNLPDLENTEQILLSFNIERIEGQLMIFLNEEKIYSAEVLAGAAQPVMLPKNSLRAENELMFKVSSPRLAFWKTNEVFLSEIKIVADVTSVAAQSSRNVFLITETEKNNFEKAALRFKPDCIFEQVGKLKITVNGREIYNAIPDCGLAIVSLDVSAEIVNQGENEIIFQAGSGNYVLSHIVFKSELKELDFPTYFFELTHEQYVAIKNGEKKAKLKLDFVDVVTEKEGEVIFNGHRRQFDTKEVTLILDLSMDVVEGGNAVKIRPQKTLDIRELRVDLVE